MNFFQQLDDCLSTFHQATDINLFLLDESGKAVSSYGEHAKFCQLFAQAIGERCPCAAKHMDAVQLAFHLGSDYVWTCPAGLFHFSVAVTRGGKLIGHVLAGPVLLDYPDSTVVDEMLQQYKLPFSMQRQFLSALNGLPLIEPQKACYISKLLFCLVTGPLNGESEFTSLQQEKSMQQSKIGEYIQIASQQPDRSDSMYSQEQVLCNYILSGNADKAQEALNQILGDMYYYSGNDLQIIRVRAIELIGMLTRTLIRVGMNPREIYCLTDTFQHQCLGMESLEDLSYLLLATVKKMTSLTVFQLGEHVSPPIRDSIAYINQHYFEHLTLEEVAEAVSLSYTYLSGLFKAEVGQTFSEYIVHLRVERSKQLLRETNLSMSEIAQLTGFDSQQYFNRVFKRETGLTPRQYRGQELAG